MILRFVKLNETNLCDINWDGLVLVGIELGELVEGLHGELFGVSGLLGGPSPSPGPSLTGRTRRRLLTGVLCHTPAYTSTPPGLHSAPAEELGGTRGLVHSAGGGALVQVHPEQNQKCSWTRFAAGPGGPETWHCLGRKLRAFLQIIAPCFPMVAPLFTWLKGHRYLAQSAAFSIFKHW